MEALQGASTPDQLQLLMDLLASTSSVPGGADPLCTSANPLLQQNGVEGLDEGNSTDKLVEVINTNGQPQYVLTSQPSRVHSMEHQIGGYTLAK